MPEPAPEAIDAFIDRWKDSGGHERGAGHQFLLEFCDLLGLDEPDPPVADNALNAYTFERRVERRKPDGKTTPNWIDLYKSGCFVTFPFPELEEGELKTRIREFGERLDAHRKARQALHPELTLTGMYNVLEKLRAEEPLSDKERKIHDDLDAAVFEAYGWEDLNKEKSASGLLISTGEIAGDDVTKRPEARFSIDWEQELLTRLVALNH